MSFSEDPGWWHKRLILHHITHGVAARFVILTPDGDLYDESVADWDHSYIISAKGAYPPKTGEGSFVQFEAPAEMKELVGFHREAADYAAEVWTREGLTPLSKVTSAVGWDGRGNLLPVEGKLAAVSRRVMYKRPPVDRREEGAELPDKVPTLPVRLDLPGADA